MLGALVLGTAATSVAATAATTPATTYHVRFTELGLASGTNWSVNFGGTWYYSTGSQLNVSGVSAGNYYWYMPSGTAGATSSIQYAPEFTDAYMNVPYQTAQVMPFTEQYKLTFAVSPAGSGTTGPTSAGSAAWYNAGSQVPITENAYSGWKFASWKSSNAANLFDDASEAATVLTVHGGATITARYQAHTSSFSFGETGLPSGTSWSAVFSGTSFASATSTVTTTFHRAGSYAYSIPTVSGTHGVEYVANPSSGYVSQPEQGTLQVVFTKEFAVTFAVSPASSGSISPSSGTTNYYPNGTELVVNAYNTSSYVFSSWGSSNSGVTLMNKANASTVAWINSTTTLTAKFVAGTPCATNCTQKFTETGVPAGTAWGLTVNGINYYASGPTLTLPKATSSYSWGVIYPLGASGGNVEYVPTQASGYSYLGQSSVQQIAFVQYDWVNVIVNPNCCGNGLTLGSNWYAQGSTVPVGTGVGVQYAFNFWKANTSAITFGLTHATSTWFTVGGPGTVTANFRQLPSRITLEEFNLPKGTTWGVSISGLLYTTTARELNVSLPSGTYTWYSIQDLAGSASGIEWSAQYYYGGFQLPVNVLADVVYTEYVYLQVYPTGSSGGGVSPYGNYWEPLGTVWGISAVNGTSVSFVSWQATATSGTLTLGSTSQASTSAVLNGPGTIYAKFA